MAPACRNAYLSISAFVSSRAEAYGRIGTRRVKYCHKRAPPSPRFNCNLVKYFSQNSLLSEIREIPFFNLGHWQAEIRQYQRPDAKLL
jgi:hypothetical protein